MPTEIEMILALFGFAGAVAFCGWRASKYDSATEMHLVQNDERRVAAEIADCLLRNFDILDVKRNGLLTKAAADEIDSSKLSEADRHLLRLAFDRFDERIVFDTNPWVLAEAASYKMTPIGHIVGQHREQRVASSGGYHVAVGTYTVVVDDYGVTREDINSYVARVNARRTLKSKAKS